MSPTRRMGRVVLNAALERVSRRRVQGIKDRPEIDRPVEPRVIPDRSENGPKSVSDDSSTK